MAFDKAKVRALREDIDRALAQVGQKHGVAFDLGRITYTEEDFKGQLRCIDQNSRAGVASPLELDWIRNVRKYPELREMRLFQKISVDGEVHTILGLKPRNRKYPVITRRESDGRQFKFSTYAAARAAGHIL